MTFNILTHRASATELTKKQQIEHTELAAWYEAEAMKIMDEKSYKDLEPVCTILTLVPLTYNYSYCCMSGKKWET